MDAAIYVFSKTSKKQNLTVALQNYAKISFKRLSFSQYFFVTFSKTFFRNIQQTFFCNVQQNI